MPAPRSTTWLRAAAFTWLGLLAGFAAGIEWINTRPDPPPAPSGGIDLVGAGATFPYPLYRRWFAEYREAAGIRINYFSVGSGEGIRLLLDEDVDFGATDRPLRVDERARARCGPVEVLTVVGAIAVVVNLPTIGNVVQLDANALAAVYLGRVTRWNDAVLTTLNPALALPDAPIRVVQRASTSGTSEIFSDYLDGAVAWRAVRGDSLAQWPVGERVEGNQGVAAQVKSTVGSLGFVELSYARQSGLAVAALRNRAGRFMLPDSASLARTASELLVTAADADTLHGLVGARDAGAYPVVAITRLVADQSLGDEIRGAHFVAFARWALLDGSRSASALGYAPLPPSVRRRQLQRLDALRPGTCPTPRSI